MSRVKFVEIIRGDRAEDRREEMKPGVYSTPNCESSPFHDFSADQPKSPSLKMGMMRPLWSSIANRLRQSGKMRPTDSQDHILACIIAPGRSRNRSFPVRHSVITLCYAYHSRLSKQPLTTCALIYRVDVILQQKK